MLPSRIAGSMRNREHWVWMPTTEPFSNTKYFYSYCLGKRVEQEEEPGVMGDRGWGVGNYLVELDHCAAFFGRWDLVRGIWRDQSPLAPEEATADGEHMSIDKTLGYFDALQDWAWMDAGSNDPGGNGPVVDCAQATYDGYAALGRMARVMGDEATALKADYLKARSTMSLISRIPFESYAKDNGIIGPDDYVAGFREDSKARSSEHFGNDMTDVKQRESLRGAFGYWETLYAGIECWDTLFPYGRYIWPQMLADKRRMDTLYLPTRPAKIVAGEEVNEQMFELFSGEPAAPLLARIKSYYFDNSVKHPHFILIPQALYCFTGVPLALTMSLSAGCPLVVGRWEPLPFPETLFDSAAKKVTLTLKGAPSGYSLGCISSKAPKTLLLNGAPLPPESWSYDKDSYNLNIKIPVGDATVDILYDTIDADRFQPVPVRMGCH